MRVGWESSLHVSASLDPTPSSVRGAGRHVIAFETDAEYYALMLRRLGSKGLIPASMVPQPAPLALTNESGVCLARVGGQEREE